jgi:hypothetical protein
MLTAGVVPNAPDTFTDAFAFELLALALELELELELGFEEPQPAMTKQASNGITMIVRRRRMKTSIVWTSGAVSLLGVLTARGPAQCAFEVTYPR